MNHSQNVGETLFMVQIPPRVNNKQRKLPLIHDRINRWTTANTQDIKMLSNINCQRKNKPKLKHTSPPAIDALYLPRPYPIDVDDSWRKIKFYLYKFHWKKIFAHRKKTNAFYTFTNNKYNKVIRLYPKTFHKRINKGRPIWVKINGKLHILGVGEGDDMFHIVFDSTIKSFPSQNSNVHEFTAWSAGNSGPGLIHIRSKNELLLLGGHGFLHQDEIWQCKLNEQFWSKLIIKLPRNNQNRDFKYLLTNNEKFIICINSRDSHIFYWQIDGEYDEWNMSSIDWDIDRTPTHCVMTGDKEYDEKIVYAYVGGITLTEINNIRNLKHLFSEILRFYSIEEINIFDFTAKRDVHWKCNIEQIIPTYHHYT